MDLIRREGISMTLEEIRSKALEMAEPEFKKFEPIALPIQKVLEAFKEC